MRGSMHDLIASHRRDSMIVTLLAIGAIEAKPPSIASAKCRNGRGLPIQVGLFVDRIHAAVLNLST